MDAAFFISSQLNQGKHILFWLKEVSFVTQGVDPPFFTKGKIVLNVLGDRGHTFHEAVTVRRSESYRRAARGPHAQSQKKRGHCGNSPVLVVHGLVVQVRLPELHRLGRSGKTRRKS